MSHYDAVLEILRKAYQIEVDGYTFYSMTADRATRPEVGEIFSKLAADELQHQAFLREVAGKLENRGMAAFAIGGRVPPAPAASQRVLSGSMRDKAAEAQFELGVLSVGMTLEQNAISYFSSAMTNATDADVRGFYSFLVDWEKQHYDALQTLFNGLRAESFEASSFAPF